MNKKSKKNNKKNNSSSSFLKRVSMNNMEFPIVIRGLVNDFAASGTGSQALAFFVNYPTYYRNPSGSIAQAATVSSLLANEQKTFDEYRVDSLRVSYLPFLQNSTSTTGMFDPSIAAGVDLDDSADFTTAGRALNSQGLAIRMRTGQGHVIPLCDFQQVDFLEKKKWLNLGAIIPSTSTAADVNNPAKLATVKVYTGLTAPAYPLTNTTIGLFVLEWCMILKGTYTIS